MPDHTELRATFDAIALDLYEAALLRRATLDAQIARLDHAITHNYWPAMLGPEPTDQEHEGAGLA